MSLRHEPRRRPLRPGRVHEPVHKQWPGFDEITDTAASRRRAPRVEALVRSQKSAQIVRARAAASRSAGARPFRPSRGEVRGAEQCSVLIALGFGERNRRRGELAGGVHDRVVRVLPALVLKAVGERWPSSRDIALPRPSSRGPAPPLARRPGRGATSPVQRMYSARSMTKSGVASTLP